MSVFDDVVRDVAEERGVLPSQIYGPARLRPIVMARRECLRRLYIDHKRRSLELAERFGMHHTGVRYHLIQAGVDMKAKRMTTTTGKKHDHHRTIQRSTEVARPEGHRSGPHTAA